MNPLPPASLSQLVAPMGSAEFLASVRDREPRHFPGDARRFDALFSFQETNRLLGMWPLWTDGTCKVVLDGRGVPAEEFCVRGQGRDGHPAMLADARRLESLLSRGATMVLDRMESLSPRVRDLAHGLQSALGGAAVCNAYCSFEAHAGFPSHYDTTEVLALHIAGMKRWRVYEGRAAQPVEMPGYSYAYQSPEHHERARGAVLMEVEMKPGDVLYLPRGQYHDALAAQGASLHLSFGITRATGLDFMSLLARSLPDEPLFRQELPHFDDAEGLGDFMGRLASRLAELLRDPDLARQVSQWQRERVFRDLPPAMALPGRAAQTRVRVRAGAGLSWDGQVLSVAGQPVELSALEISAVDWIFGREMFLASQLVSEVLMDEPGAAALLDRLARAGVVEPV